MEEILDEIFGKDVKILMHHTGGNDYADFTTEQVAELIFALKYGDGIVHVSVTDPETAEVSDYDVVGITVQGRKYNEYPRIIATGFETKREEGGQNES